MQHALIFGDRYIIMYAIDYHEIEYYDFVALLFSLMLVLLFSLSSFLLSVFFLTDADHICIIVRCIFLIFSCEYMRPADLKFPFAGKERHVLLHDKILYVPERENPQESFIFPEWAHPYIFGNDYPICVEYCSGNGAWIAEKAKMYPMINWVAVEKKFVRARKIWSKIKNLQLNNLLVVCGEAHHVTERYFSDGSVQDVYINFPDPWPKNKHAKHRLIQHEFAKEIWRILKKKGSLTFVTDDPPYSDWLIKVIRTHSGFVPTYSDPYYITEQTDYGSSYFDELWRAKGRMIRYHHFQKIPMLT